jgi:hypothetical protein
MDSFEQMKFEVLLAQSRRECAALREENERLRRVADELARQVEEFETWDQDDWPAALHCLQGHAKAARAALNSTEGSGDAS